MAMDLREYFRMKCTEMLAAEREILQMNDMMAGEVQNPQVKGLFQQHSTPTKQQISNLEQILNKYGGPSERDEGMLKKLEDALGMQAAGKGTPVTHAMARMHMMVKGMNPDQKLTDLNDLLEGGEVEHFEIAQYEGLIALAKMLGDNDSARMLQENLNGEQQALTQIQMMLPMLISNISGPGSMAA